MFAEEWKLGEDLIEDDHILDPISFNDVILALHCGSPNITGQEMRKVFREILDQRMTDAEYLLRKNEKEILRRAKIGRAGYEGKV